MPFNGAGVFTRVYQWVNDAANGIYVDATRTDTDTNDIATGLSNCVTRDGQSPPTANLPMASKKFTGLTTGSASGDSVNYGQVFDSPAFVTPSATTTPTLGSNNLLLATTAYVDQTAFSTALPSQAGNAGKFIQTNGTSASWVPLLATQTQMEAATDNTVVPTALTTNFHPGVAKCWISANGAGTVINASHNITSITDDGTGLLTVTIATDFSSANYAISAQTNSGGNDNLVSISAQTAGSFSLRCWNPGAVTLIDPTSYFAACFGDQ